MVLSTMQQLYSTGSLSSISLAVGDLNKDKRLDLIVVNNDTDTIDVLFGYFQGFPDSTNLFYWRSNPQSVAVGDFEQRHSTRYRCCQFSR